MLLRTGNEVPKSHINGKNLSSFVNESEVIGKRFSLENPQEFFDLVKNSPKYSSWNGLVKTSGCSNTSLKARRRGERTFPGKTFLNLLDYLSGEQKKYVLSKTKALDENWGASKGGRQSVKNRKEKLGEKGFLESMAKIRENSEGSDLSAWHYKMKRDNPKHYSKIQRERWLSMLRIWGHNDKIRKKAVKSLRERYGDNYFTTLGLSGASNQQLNKREKAIEDKIQNLGFDIEPHKTILSYNFDFAYKKDGCLKAVEEGLGFRKKIALNFFNLLVLHEKYKKLTKEHDVPFFISTWYEVNLKYKSKDFH